MPVRSNWYSDHPPACTCASCMGSRRPARRRQPPSPAQDRRSGRYRPPPRRPPARTTRPARSGGGGPRLGILIVAALIATFAVGFIVYGNGDEWFEARKVDLEESLELIGVEPTPIPPQRSGHCGGGRGESPGDAALRPWPEHAGDSRGPGTCNRRGAVWHANIDLYAGAYLHARADGHSPDANGHA